MYSKYLGKRKENGINVQSITIFLWSFIYPTTTGGLKRMAMLIEWANKKSLSINLIIPYSGEMPNREIIDKHLEFCNFLFLVQEKNSRVSLFAIKIIRLFYALLTGRHPPMHSFMILNYALVKDIKSIFKGINIGYFLNTRHNFMGLVNFINNENVIKIIDTQDLYTDMYKKYSMKKRSYLMKKILCGYRENSQIFKSELNCLNNYKKIIAITESDYYFYKNSLSNVSNISIIKSINIKPRNISVTNNLNKKYDILIVASDFIGTRLGLDWLLHKVLIYFQNSVSICVVGSIGAYANSISNINHKIKLTIHGVVENVDKYYEESRVVALCMLEATGTSVKGLEAFSFGAAVVSTPAGVRFDESIPEDTCIIELEPYKFAEKLQQLITNSNQQKIYGNNALNYAKNFHDKNNIYDQLDEVFELHE